MRRFILSQQQSDLRRNIKSDIIWALLHSQLLWNDEVKAKLMASVNSNVAKMFNDAYKYHCSSEERIAFTHQIAKALEYDKEFFVCNGLAWAVVNTHTAEVVVECTSEEYAEMLCDKLNAGASAEELFAAIVTDGEWKPVEKEGENVEKEINSVSR